MNAPEFPATLFRVESAKCTKIQSNAVCKTECFTAIFHDKLLWAEANWHCPVCFCLERSLQKVELAESSINLVIVFLALYFAIRLVWKPRNLSSLSKNAVKPPPSGVGI